MSLPEDYTRYPLRKHGQDQDRHHWRPITERAPATLPDGKTLGVSIVVPLEFFMLNPSGKPFKHPGAMVTPYPDLRHYTTRDYGNRVGAYRLLDAFAKAGVKATFAVNAALLDRINPLIADIAADGHEIAAHGYDTDSLHWGGVEPEIERGYVSETRKAFQRAGLTPRTWLSPARQQSYSTLDLVRAEGFDICLDWETDTVPLAMHTNAGEVRAFPLLNELDDRNLLIAKNHSEEDWLRQIVEAADMMKSDAPRHGASVFGFTMTPYISGLPYRMWAVREILAMLANDDKILCASVSTLTDAVKS
ncbi:MAG: polysaccharide deacetylase family protein [Parvularculaceae bacterium]|nr:polysaccharide deacetylase family protein [Parvularculaceae bacterium]